MTNENPSDDAIIAEERRRHRRSSFDWLITFLLILALLFAIREAAVYGFLPSSFLRHPGLMALAVGVTLAVVKTPFILRNMPPFGAMNKRIMRRQIDDHHMRWRLKYLQLALAVFFGTGGLSIMLARHLAISKGWSAAIFVLIALAFIRQILFGPATKLLRKMLDDELTIELRARSIRMGYAALMATLCGGFAAALYHPEWALQILLWTAATGIFVPAVSYAFLDWRSSSDG